MSEGELLLAVFPMAFTAILYLSGHIKSNESPSESVCFSLVIINRD